MPNHIRTLVLLTLGALTAACHIGHDDDSSPGTPTTGTLQRGSLLKNPPTLVGTYTPAQLQAVLGGNDLGEILLLQLAYTPKCTISVYHLDYETVDPAGNLTPAGGALMVPSGDDTADCTGARPIVEYAHGTSYTRTYDISAFASTNNGEGMVLAAVFAAEGYIVVAPNYVGYDTSTLAYHPYLVADQQSKDMIDALTAARALLPTADAPTSTDGGKLFITGYSQGGFVANATHRALQAAGIAVTAAADLSGPYALSALTDAIFEGEVNDSGVQNGVMLLTAYQNAYGNVYTTATDVFDPAYASVVNGLLPGTTPVSALMSAGTLPAALFSSTPPDPSYAAQTPATAPAVLAPIFALGFGTPFLVTNAYRLAFLQDAAANPDGGFPTPTNGLPPAAPGNTLRQDFKTNDLRNWTPTAPVLLCAGNSDPTVFYFNTQLMANYWTSVGYSGYTLLDVDSAPVAGDPYATIKNEFAAAKATLTLADGTTGMLEDYHAGLVPPFCLSAAKGFFDGY